MYRESYNKKVPALHATRYTFCGTRGFTLFYAMLISSLLLAIGIAIFNITFKELTLSSGARESANAFYAADTGLECALYWDLKHAALSAPAFGFYGDSLASGLTGYWRFEDNTGSLIALDSSGSGNVGALTNMDAEVAWVDGHIGDAITFDGVDDRVVTPAPPIVGSGNRTVAFWVRPAELISSVSDHLVEWGTTAVNGARYTVKLDPGNVLRVEISGSNFVSSLVVPQGVWSFVAVVMDGPTLGDNRLYVNSSSQDATGANSIDTGSDNGVNIGGSFAFSDRYFNGAIDDVRIYNRALSETEIEKLYEEESNLMFVQPTSQSSNATCNGEDITDPATGWDPLEGWTVATTTTSATTTFDMLFDEGRCATVEVYKNSATTTIVSRGYNSCNENDPRRVERAIRAIY